MPVWEASSPLRVVSPPAPTSITPHFWFSSESHLKQRTALSLSTHHPDLDHHFAISLFATMSKRFLTAGALALAGGAGYYMYQAGGDPKAAEKRAEGMQPFQPCSLPSKAATR